MLFRLEPVLQKEFEIEVLFICKYNTTLHFLRKNIAETKYNIFY